MAGEQDEGTQSPEMGHTDTGHVQNTNLKGSKNSPGLNTAGKGVPANRNRQPSPDYIPDTLFIEGTGPKRSGAAENI